MKPIARTMSPHVEYRPCPRLPADRYRFGSDGSAWYRRPNWRPDLWHRLAVISNNGHAMVRVRTDGRKRYYLLGPLVLSAFGDPRPLGCECGYANGDRMDCRLANLSWQPKGSAMRIAMQRRRDRPICSRGTPSNRGEAHPRARLTEAKVIEARRLYLLGHTVAGLADHYGVGAITMNSALTGRSWRHVPGAVRLRRGGVWGSAAGGAKLDEIDVAEIKSLIRAGWRPPRIARRYGVCPATIRNIARGESWIHVEPAADFGGPDHEG